MIIQNSKDVQGVTSPGLMILVLYSPHKEWNNSLTVANFKNEKWNRIHR